MKKENGIGIVLGSDLISENQVSFYQIDFGNHLRCKLQICNNQVTVIGAVNGWGNGVPLYEVKIIEVDE